MKKLLLLAGLVFLSQCTAEDLYYGTPRQVASTKRCPRCFTANDPENVYCTHCGAPFEKTCPSCHTENPGDALFCQQCGKPIGDVKVAAVRKPKEMPHEETKTPPKEETTKTPHELPKQEPPKEEQKPKEPPKVESPKSEAPKETPPEMIKPSEQPKIEQVQKEPPKEAQKPPEEKKPEQEKVSEKWAQYHQEMLSKGYKLYHCFQCQKQLYGKPGGDGYCPYCDTQSHFPQDKDVTEPYKK